MVSWSFMTPYLMLSPLQAELDQLRYSIRPPEGSPDVFPEGGSLEVFREIVSEVRRNFATSSCSQGACGHQEDPPK